ncbi:MAG: hypothetical protein ACE3L7_32150 [Candidatus Pristimantibacillus sp.]
MAYIDEKEYQKWFAEAEELLESKHKIEDYLDKHNAETEEKNELEDEMAGIDDNLVLIAFAMMDKLKQDLKI